MKKKEGEEDEKEGREKREKGERKKLSEYMGRKKKEKE